MTPGGGTEAGVSRRRATKASPAGNRTGRQSSGRIRPIVTAAPQKVRMAREGWTAANQQSGRLPSPAGSEGQGMSATDSQRRPPSHSR